MSKFNLNKIHFDRYKEVYINGVQASKEDIEALIEYVNTNKQKVARVVSNLKSIWVETKEIFE